MHSSWLRCNTTTSMYRDVQIEGGCLWLFNFHHFLRDLEFIFQKTSVSMADNKSVCSFEEDLLSCDIRDECSYAQKTNNKDNNEDDVCKESCFDQEDAVNKAKSLGIIGWTVLKRYGGSYDLKKGIVDSYDVSTRFFKVKYKDGSMDTIVERELLGCLGDPHRRGFPHHLFLEPPVPEGEKPKRRPVLMMRATPRFQQRTPQRRTAKGNKKGKGTGRYERRNAQAENGGGDGSPKETRVGKAAEASGTEAQTAAGDGVPAEIAGGVGSLKNL